ncbi:MAG: hypothetical protein EAZ89_19955 [Bacteroidetes bacterium]|nr:MAG: hypothetical protein EAZ89_19955 [Bacteroidota bacterium]
MKNKKIVWGAFLLIFSPLAGVSQTFPHLSFQKFYDNGADDRPRSIVATNDGHLVLGGNSYFPDSSKACSNVWVLKVSESGERLWEQEITLDGCEELRDMSACPDGGVLFAGVADTPLEHTEAGDEPYRADIFVGKLSAAGELEWLKHFGGSQSEQATGIVQGLNEEFMIAGISHSKDLDVGANQGMSDIWALKVNTSGELRGSYPAGEGGQELAFSISVCENGDFLLAGSSTSGDRGQAWEQPLLLRIAPDGSLRWMRSIPMPLGGRAQGAAEASDGRIFVSGIQRSADGRGDFWWARLTAEGKKITSQALSSSGDEGWLGIVPCDPEGFLLSGYADAGPQAKARGGEDFWLLRLDGKGNLVWRNTFGGPDHERAVDAVSFSPGVFYALGEKKNTFGENPARKDRDFWLLRIEEYPSDSIQADIFVRAKEYRINRDTPTRFRANSPYGERYLWDFGDGSTSTEAEPLKSYEFPGMYEITLTVYVNEHCSRTLKMERLLEVW